MIDHRSYAGNLSSCELKAENNSGLNEIQTHDFCDNVAVLYQLSYQANWELTTLWVRKITVFQALISQLLKLCAWLRWSIISIIYEIL